MVGKEEREKIRQYIEENKDTPIYLLERMICDKFDVSRYEANREIIEFSTED